MVSENFEKFFWTFLGLGTNVVKVSSVNSELLFQWDTLSRTFGERFKEHLNDPSPVHHHSNNTGHPTSQNNLQIIGRGGHGLVRNIKEAIFIRVNNPTLDRNIGKFNLPTYGTGSYLIHLALL